jgi:predicted ferric reductase
MRQQASSNATTRSFLGVVIGTVIAVLYMVLWVVARPADIRIMSYIGEILGVEAIVFMSWSLVLATVLPGLEAAFGGLDRQAIWHRRTALIGVTLAFLHQLLTEPNRSSSPFGATLGSIGFYGLLALIAWALLSPTSWAARWGGPLGWVARIGYDRWLSIHRLTGVFVVIAMVHGKVADPTLPGSQLLNVTYLVICGVGTAAFLYRELVMRFILLRAEYRVAKVDRPNARTLVVDLEPRAAPLRFVPGQFVYVDFANNGWHPHPFTIASGLSSRTLQLAIRDSGAETHALYGALQSGSTVRVGKPHGQFDYHGGGVHQVWIAGGIGITPFISWIRSLDDAFDHEVDFFYTVADEHDALFLKEIQAAAARHPSLRVHLVASDRDGLLTSDQIAKTAPSPLEQVWVYMCGPAPMMDSFAQRFRQLGVPRQHIFWEEFAVR